MEFPGGASGKEPASQCRIYKRCWFDPWVGKILCGRAWQATAVFLPGVRHGQRSLVGYSLWGLKELDTTEATSHVCAFCVWVNVGLKVDIYRGS